MRLPGRRRGATTGERQKPRLTCGFGSEPRRGFEPLTGRLQGGCSAWLSYLGPPRFYVSGRAAIRRLANEGPFTAQPETRGSLMPRDRRGREGAIGAGFAGSRETALVAPVSFPWDALLPVLLFSICRRQLGGYAVDRRKSGSDRDARRLEGSRGQLDARSRSILDFEREWWKHPGTKQHAVRERFGLSPARYYQLLNRLMDDDEALAYDPMLVRRLRRLRAARQRRRTGSRFGVDSSP